MKTELVDLNDTRRTLSVEIPAAEVDAAIDRVTRQYGRSAKLPGFRPGKVPAKVVRQRFRSQILHDVAHQLIPRAVDSALGERGVEPVDTPDIRDVVVEEGRPLTFTAIFDVVPPFDPGDFTSIQVRRARVDLSDEAVPQNLERLRERAARFEPVDEGTAAAEGHTLILDLERTAIARDGSRNEPDRHKQVSIEIGGKANPPGFDAEVIGMVPGERRSFTLTYPEDYAVLELAGGQVAYAVTLKEIRQRVVPELDDEFAKDLGDFDTLDALRDRVREDLETEAREAAERDLRADLLRQLAQRLPFAVPDALVDREVDRRVEEFARRLMEQRIDPRTTNIDWASFREGQKAPAAEAVGSALVLDEVARREQIAITEAELEAELERYAQQSGRTIAAVRAQLERDGGVGRLQAGLRREKALASVLARVQVLEI
jgi:trigger factor